MSWETSSFVLNLRVGDATAKLILLGHSNHVGPDGTSSYAGTATIAEYAECSSRTVQRWTKYLLDNGFMREGDQSLVAGFPPDRRPIVYDIAMSPETIESWKNGRSSGVRERAAANGAQGAEKTNAGRGDKMTGRGDLDGATPVSGRGATPVTERGDTALSGEPPTNHPEQPPVVGDADASPTTPPPLRDDASTEVEVATPKPVARRANGETTAQAEEITKGFWTWAEAEGVALAQRYLSVRSIVKTALDNRVDPGQLKWALCDLGQRGEVITTQSLQSGLRRVKPGNGAAGMFTKPKDQTWYEQSHARAAAREAAGGGGDR